MTTTEESPSQEFLAAGEKKSDDLISMFELSLACQDGAPQSTHNEGSKSYPHISYAYGHVGFEDRREALCDKFVDLIERLKAAGATRLVWRSKPRFIYNVREDGVRTILRARFACIARDGTEVKVQETQEGQEPGWIGDVTPLGTQGAAEELNEASVVNPVLGYDLIKVTDDAVLHCAAVVHAAIKALNDFHNEPTLTFEQSRDSTVAGIRNLLKNPGMTPEDQHNAWLETKRADGWSYGESKDFEKKTHPCFLPYKLLPDAQRVKDYVFQGVIRAYFGSAELHG